ncbi:hypothetical protein [Saccharothrix variisporea]|uniref:Uncharacterized protein n=1 Tax=Saccharothrix variisporea TaxID=543527 RepID=A0A495X0A9_9PSEU|nr:hypothetical protein [Saccharothrix variisporea]RKT67099.1 hypothetical protein DFJ66_0267 [Saccharothrix variisporea]
MGRAVHQIDRELKRVWRELLAAVERVDFDAACDCAERIDILLDQRGDLTRVD